MLQLGWKGDARSWEGSLQCPKWSYQRHRNASLSNSRARCHGTSSRYGKTISLSMAHGRFLVPELVLHVQWCHVIRSWLQEAEWSKKDYTPSIDEYLRVAGISTAVQTIVLPSLYFVGPIISEEMIHHPDYIKIAELVMISARLLNDLQTYEVN